MFESILKWANAAAPIASAGASLYSAYEARQSSKREAGRIQEQARRQGDATRREAQRLKAKQRARYSAAGVTLDGTAQEILDETDALAEKDVADILYYGGQASRDARRGGNATAIGNSLTGFGSLLGGYKTWNDLGLFN
ncbi:MAG: hypothetical protein RIG26_14995 [Thalassospira sp.]|uniref:hypothetical protein n=1 Tax=Thalassospira sp. TaxID=1912094 RepID=UPI0032EF5CCC